MHREPGPAAPRASIGPNVHEAMEAARDDRWEDAVRALDALMPQLEGPEAPHLWSLYAQALARTCRIKEAASAARRALQAAPAEAAHWVLLGELLHARGEEEEALAALRRATDLDPANGEAWRTRAVICLVLGKGEEARTCGERAVTIDPGSPLAWRNLAGVFREAGHLEGARRCLEKVVRLDPEGEDAWCDLLCTHLRAHDDDGAQVAYRQLVEVYGPRAKAVVQRLAAVVGWTEGEACAYFADRDMSSATGRPRP